MEFLWILIGYWLDMEIYVRVLVRSNIARRQERNINYAPERVHIFPYPTKNLFITYALLSQKTVWHLLYNFYQQNFKITSVLNKQKLKFKKKVKQVLPLPFLRLSRNMNVYSKEFHSKFLEHLHIFICIIYILIEDLIFNAQRKMIPVTFTRTYIN